MPAAKSALKRLRIIARLRRAQLAHARAELARALRGEPRGRAKVLFILGCQRSGTTLMTELFEADPGAKVYPEHSSLSAADAVDRLRLGPTDVVASAVRRSRFPRIVLKPLVESQRARALLDAIPGSRALWMVRGWRDVVRSNLARFGDANGIRNLRFIVEGCAANWRAECLPAEVDAVVADLFDEDMAPSDAAALFWWVRNQHYFAQRLDSEPRVRMCIYEDLVSDPTSEMKRIYGFMGEDMPGDLGFARVSGSSVGLGASIEVSPRVASLCDELQARLGAAREGRS
jgi:hypothetical protein